MSRWCARQREDAGRPVNLGHHRHTEKSHTRRPWAIRRLTKPGALHPPLCGALWGFESCFGALAVPDRASEFLHCWRQVADDDGVQCAVVEDDVTAAAPVL